MTHLSRKAIVEYWLFKRWAEVSPKMFRYMSNRRRVVSAAVYTILFVGGLVASQVHAAELEKEAAIKPDKAKSVWQNVLDKKTELTAAPSVKKVTSEAKKSGTKASTSKNWLIKKTPKKEPFSSYKLPDISPEEQNEPGYDKTLKGRVSVRSAYGIGVVYGGDPETGEVESWNNFTSKMKLIGVKKISDIEEGDTVEVMYKQLIKKNKRLLTGVRLVHKLTKEERAAQEKALQDSSEDNAAPVAAVSAAAKSVSKEMTNGATKIL